MPPPVDKPTIILNLGEQCSPPPDVNVGPQYYHVPVGKRVFRAACHDTPWANAHYLEEGFERYTKAWQACTNPEDAFQISMARYM